MVDKDKIIDFFIYINLSVKGLRKAELKRVSELNTKQVEVLLEFFGPGLVEFDGYFKIIDGKMASYFELMTNDEQIIPFYRKIGETLDTSPHSLRKMEEQSYAFMKANEYFSAKQLLTSIENFLFMFNPEFKLNLMTFWVTLIEQNYDPVIEYNKNLEDFVMHNQPSNENIFYIVVQLSRFFKELADFEDKNVPEFRHPKIVNKLLSIKKETIINSNFNSRQHSITKVSPRGDKNSTVDIFN